MASPITVAPSTVEVDLFNAADPHCEGCGGLGRRRSTCLVAGRPVTDLVPCACTATTVSAVG